jgi:hypothetical protein
LSVKPTTEGVIREPEELIKTFGEEPSITATTEFVVPKSIPIILAIVIFLSLYCVPSVYINFQRFNCAKSVPVGVMSRLSSFNLLRFKRLSCFLPTFFKFQFFIYCAILADLNYIVKP